MSSSFARSAMPSKSPKPAFSSTSMKPSGSGSSLGVDSGLGSGAGTAIEASHTIVHLPMNSVSVSPNFFFKSASSLTRSLPACFSAALLSADAVLVPGACVS